MEGIVMNWFRAHLTLATAGAILLVGIGLGAGWGRGLRASAQGGDPLSSATLMELPIRLTQSAQIRPTGQVKSFDLTARATTWELLPGVTADAVAYNGQVPGPTIRVTEGDTLRVILRNELDQATSIHWHGLHVPNAMDGVPGVTQAPVRPGETFTYEFTASHAGTFMYHPHINSVAQIDRGLSGVLIIDPQTPDPTRFDREFTMMLGAWQIQGPTPPGAAAPAMADHGMGMGAGTSMGMGMGYNYFTINGKAFPALDPWPVREGELIRVRLINISNLTHPMHLHGQDFKVIAKDGEPLREQLVANTLSVGAGETYDIAFLANNPGNWMFHCHELHHTENDGVEPGGLMQLIQYEGAPRSAPLSPVGPGGQHGGH